jgi:uncharacterized tellurite resistance protein B-like protein
MFEALKRFIADISDQPRANDFADDDYRLAAVALLVHVANVDGSIDRQECSRLRSLIEERFGLNAEATTRLIQKAEASDREAVDFYHFTSVLKRALDENGRLKILEMMWDIAFADGAVQEFEENVVARVAELLGIAPRDRLLSRQRVASEAAAAEPIPSGPWTSLAGSKT